MRKFYPEQDMITNAAIDKFPSGAYMDPKLPYTQTGINVNNGISSENKTELGDLHCNNQSR